MIKLSSNKSIPGSLTPKDPICAIDLYRAYRIAVLLTGGSVLAEEAVIRAIESVNLDTVTTDQLFERTVIAATEMAVSAGEARFTPDEVNVLPAELQNVALLPANLRHPFVLRVLLCKSRDASAQLLDLEASAVDPTAGLAAQMLVCLESQRNRAVH